MTEQWQLDFGSVWDTGQWQIAWGKPVSSLRTLYEGRTGGIAILARRGLPFKRVEPTSDITKRLWDCGRWVLASVGIGNGQVALHVLSAYGFTNSRVWNPR